MSEDTKNGVNAKILTTIAASIDADIIFKYAPFKRRLIMMKNGDIDMSCGLLKNNERAEYIHYILPPYKNRSDTIFFVKKGQAGRIKTYEDLAGLKIGVIRGARFFEQFDTDQTSNKDYCEQTTTNFRKLIFNRVDTVISNEAAGIDIIHRLGISNQVEMSNFRFSKEKHVYIGISKKSHLMDKIHLLEPRIKEMINTQKISQIITRHYRELGVPVPAF
ncbi:MAG: transporter substrate-binding domain-containing protein [Desulfobacter sp.]|nr:MAG: transporter substrate-binding domain-containing protein [Desulfobacter sp.]